MSQASFASRFKKVKLVLPRTGTTDVTAHTNLTGFRYFKCANFRAKVASSGATSQIQLTDGNGDVFYKDAADKDYQTATVQRVFAQDDTAITGGVTASDATGAAVTFVTGVNSAPPAILEGPVTVTWIDADGAAGTLTLELLLELMPPPGFRKRVATLTRTATGDVIKTVGVGGSKLFTCSGFRAKDTGPTNSKIELKDANGVIFYLDAATADYHTAEITRSFMRDDTATGLGLSPADATGAALAVGQVVPPAILRAPITVRWNNATDTTGTMRLELMVEV